MLAAICIEPAGVLADLDHALVHDQLQFERERPALQRHHAGAVNILGLNGHEVGAAICVLRVLAPEFGPRAINKPGHDGKAQGGNHYKLSFLAQEHVFMPPAARGGNEPPGCDYKRFDLLHEIIITRLSASDKNASGV